MKTFSSFLRLPGWIVAANHKYVLGLFSSLVGYGGK